MFNELNASDKKLAKKLLESMQELRLRMSKVMSHDQICDIIKASIQESSYKQEILDCLFDRQAQSEREWLRAELKRQKRRKANYERNRQRYEDSRRRNEEYWNRYSGGGWGYAGATEGLIEKALKFFGFSSMPNSDDLKRRYRQLAMQLHPDKGGSTAVFQEFQNHKEILFRRVGV